jgi:hypothetical protein
MERMKLEFIPIVVGPEEDAAIAAVRALALRLAAEYIHHGEAIPEPFTKVFSGMSRWRSVKAK